MTNPEPVKVVLVDDHDLLRRGIRTMLESEGVEVVGEAADGSKVLQLVEESLPDVVLFVFDALKAGASGYLLKTAELEDVVDTVQSVAKGEGRLDPVLATKVLTEFQMYQKDEVGVYQPLTPREKQILQHMSEGLPNKTIASRLTISERTVTTHVANIYSKLHVNNRVSAIQEAMRRRILSIHPGS